jgi:hypothetical protein
LIRRNNGTFSPEGEFLAKDSWDCDDQGGEEENTHDDEGKDPLECDDLCEELANSDGGCQDAQREAYGIVLLGRLAIIVPLGLWWNQTNFVRDEEEQSIDQDPPDCNIGQNASW